MSTNISNTQSRRYRFPFWNFLKNRRLPTLHISQQPGRYYAQSGEDYILDQFFGGKLSGVCVDVGAFDGIHLSNTYSFEQKGWTGICVEPHPDYFQLCKINRPGSLCIHAACVKDENVKKINIFADQTGLFSSAVFDESRQSMHDHYRTLHLAVGARETFQVKARTLTNILNRSKLRNLSIDFISVDAEGLEQDIVSGLDLSKYAPAVFLVETSTNEHVESMKQYMKEREYHFCRRVGANSIFVKDRQEVERMREIELTCVLEKQAHPRGKQYTQTEFWEGKYIWNGQDAKKLLLRTVDRANELEDIVEGIRRKLVDKDERYKCIIEDLKKERNDKVEGLSALIREGRKERDAKVAELISIRVDELERTLDDMRKRSLEKDKKYGRIIDGLKAERNEKVAMMSTIIENSRVERNAKVAELVSVIDKLKRGNYTTDSGSGAGE